MPDGGSSPSLTDLFVPLARSCVLGDGAPLDLAAGLRIVAEDRRAAGVAAALEAVITRGMAPPASGEAPATLTLRFDPGLEGEAYRLVIEEGGAVAEAATPEGLARAGATFLQLVDPSAGVALATVVEDSPAFRWRGVLIDVVRHFLSIGALRRTIDAVALSKGNVVHLHLTDDQAWRLESASFPELTARAAPGGHYTVAEMRDLVAYATDRGVRVVPELDVPGHTAALLVARPDLALGSPPAAIPTAYVVPGVAIDPEREDVLAFLDTILGEWAEVFPDPFVHLGGDEAPVVGEDRQAAFTVRLVEVLRSHGRTAVVWDEALHPDLPLDVVVQAWRAPVKLYEAVRAGHRAILSSGWYLDLGVPVPFLQAVEPLAPPAELEGAVLAPWHDRELSGRVGKVAAATVTGVGSIAETDPLTVEERARVLGGEACLWTERVRPELLDTYLWPAAAAVFDRLWSGRALDALDPVLAESRLDLLPDLRRWTAVRPSAGPAAIVADLARRAADLLGADRAGAAELALAALADWCEPVRWYARATAGWPEANGRSPDAPEPGTGQPLDRFADALVPSCAGRRRWEGLRRSPAAEVDGGLDGEAHALVAAWRQPASVLAPLADGPSILAEPARIAVRLDEAADLLSALLAIPPSDREPPDLEAVRALHAPVGDATVALHAVFHAVVARPA